MGRSLLYLGDIDHARSSFANDTRLFPYGLTERLVDPLGLLFGLDVLIGPRGEADPIELPSVLEAAPPQVFASIPSSTRMLGSGSV